MAFIDNQQDSLDRSPGAESESVQSQPQYPREESATSLNRWLRFAQAAKELPSNSNGRPVSPSTIARWAKSGLQGVVLASHLMGGVRVVTRKGLHEFFLEVTRRRDAGNNEPFQSEADSVIKTTDRIESILDKELG